MHRSDKLHSVAAVVLCAVCMLGLVAAGVARMSSFNAQKDVPSLASAASTDGAETDSAPLADADAAPLAIAESGWNAKDGYVHYGVVVDNPNASYLARKTKLSVTGKDESGDVLFTDTVDLAEVAPASRTGFAGKAGNGWEPTTVDFALVQDDAEWSRAEGYVEPYTIADYQENDILYFRYELEASLTNNTDEYASTVPVSVIMRAQDGSIVAGYEGAAYRVKPKRTKSFTMTMSSAPDHASIEVYAHAPE